MMNTIPIYVIVALLIIGPIILLMCKLYVNNRTNIYALYGTDTPEEPETRLKLYDGSKYLYKPLRNKDGDYERVNKVSLQQLYTSFKFMGPDEYDLKEGDIVLMANQSLLLDPVENDLVVMINVNQETQQTYYSVRKIKLIFPDFEPGDRRYLLEPTEEINKEEIEENLDDENLTELVKYTVHETDILGILLLKSV